MGLSQLTMAKILVVEDDEDLQNLMKGLLTAERHSVEAVNNGIDAVQMLKMHKYDLIVLDWMLPGLTGTEVCAEYRAKGGALPILMLTAKSTIEEKEIGLDAGADDYLTKPFDARELLARIRALLRRPQAVSAKEMQVGNLALDPRSAKVFKDGAEIKLLPKEFSLLELFMRYPNQISVLKLFWSESGQQIRPLLSTLSARTSKPCAKK